MPRDRMIPAAFPHSHPICTQDKAQQPLPWSRRPLFPPGTLQGMEIRQPLGSCLGRCLESFQQVVWESTKIKEHPSTSPGESAHPNCGTATKWCSDWPLRWP